MAEALGLGVRTGIELPFESAGLVPDNAWKSRTYNDGWRPGDTCNLSIGQGALTVTPLQMAMFTAAIANGGYVYKPTLILRKGGRSRSPSKKMAWSARNLKVVRDGMYDVVQAEKGTGKRARISEFTMGGKTGSAEYGPREKRKKYAWMIVFGPFDNPRYALAIVIEDAVAGGVTAAPRVKELMEGICLLEKEGHRYAVAKAGTSDRRLSGERVE
jgi:penicillin-binding protein 2